MADEKRARVHTTQMAITDLGNAAAVKAIPAAELSKSGGVLLLGHLVGKVSGISERTDKKTGNTYEGLSGYFLNIPADAAKEEMESTVLFIPDAAHDMVAAKFRAMQSRDKGKLLEFGFELGSTVETKNPSGYTWKFKPLFEFKPRHVLDDTLATLGKLLAKK